MARLLACRYKNLPSFLVFLCVVICFAPLRCNGLGKEAPFSFSFDGFGMNVSSVSEIVLHGDAVVSGTSVKLTRPANSSDGRMVYREPVRFFGIEPGFSTYFSFSVSSAGQLLFFLLPRSVQFKSNLMLPSAISIELTHQSINGSENSITFRVGRHELSKRFNLSSDKLYSWIDYDGASKRLEVRVSKSKDSRPTNALMSMATDLSNILWREAMVVGLSSSNRDLNRTCTIYSWHFSTKHGAPYRMHSEPLNPDAYLVHSLERPSVDSKKPRYPWGMILAMLFAAACGALVAFFVMFLWTALVARRPVAPVEYPVHPVDVVYEKIVLAGFKDVDSAKKSGP